MDPNAAALVERLKKLSSSVVSDVLDKCGYPQQSLSGAIRPLAPAMRLAGPVACFSGVTITASGSASAATAMSSYEIDRRISPGMVVLIATNGHAVAAVVGGLMALSFSLRQCGGIVGDADGVMVIPRAVAPRIIEWAEKLAAIEETIVTQLKSGLPRESVFAANPRFAHIGRLREP